MLSLTSLLSGQDSDSLSFLHDPLFLFIEVNSVLDRILESFNFRYWHYTLDCSFAEPLVQKLIWFNPALLKAWHRRQTQPFSSLMQVLFPIAARQYPPFSPQSTQLGHVIQIHMPSTSSMVSALSSMSASQFYHTDIGHDKLFV